MIRKGEKAFSHSGAYFAKNNPPFIKAVTRESPRSERAMSRYVRCIKFRKGRKRKREKRRKTLQLNQMPRIRQANQQTRKQKDAPQQNVNKCLPIVSMLGQVPNSEQPPAPSPAIGGWWKPRNSSQTGLETLTRKGSVDQHASPRWTPTLDFASRGTRAGTQGSVSIEFSKFSSSSGVINKQVLAEKEPIF